MCRLTCCRSSLLCTGALERDRPLPSLFHCTPPAPTPVQCTAPMNGSCSPIACYGPQIAVCIVVPGHVGAPLERVRSVTLGQCH